MRVLRFDLQRSSLEYHFHELYQAFDPGVKIVLAGKADGLLTQRCQGSHLFLSLSFKNKKTLQAYYQLNKRTKPLEESVYKGFLYDLLSKYFEKTLEWGTFTGIKPVKVVQKLEEQGVCYDAIYKRLRTYYQVSEDRSHLMIELAKKQKACIDFQKKESNRVGIYIGIPLCPAKCSYCSFISTVVDKNRMNLEWYFKNLIFEINKIGAVFSDKNFIIDSVYIGGGTPTVLLEKELEVLMCTLKNAFDLRQLREYTLEAGRAETISKEKLEIAKSFGVERICLNPQSMNPKTLARVGRYWEENLIEKQREQIKKIGFKSLNMDLIAGLPGETPNDFMRSLEVVLDLNPQNITIHNLSIKKGSLMKHDEGIQVQKGYGEKFYQEVRSQLSKKGYDPYYLYRLKYTRGNSENIGYAKAGHESIYNILMMAEKQSIIGLGAGSTGKYYHPLEKRIHRVFTVKDIKTYNEKINEMVKRKVLDYMKFF